VALVYVWSHKHLYLKSPFFFIGAPRTSVKNLFYWIDVARNKPGDLDVADARATANF